MNKEKVLDLLKSEESVIINFEKLNGDIRELNCTLNKRLIPHTSFRETDIVDEDKCHVYLVNDQENGWRTFFWNKLISVNGEVFDE